ncbi:MAG: hypothetical protein H8E86_05460 [Planctomycetes bacterium]|nr:hypothetical protein [Planctomycetota bacterium]
MQQVTEQLKIPCHYSSADGPTLRDSGWLHQQWEFARKSTDDNETNEAFLIFDDFGKITRLDGWQKINYPPGSYT